MKRVLILAIVLVLLVPLSASAQIITSSPFDLRDLLTDFLKNGITLAPPPANSGFPNHTAHFIGADSPQFQGLESFNRLFSAQLSSYPLPSPGGGFTYSYDPSAGVFSRSSDSFGPIFGERAETIGKGKFNLGVNYGHYVFQKIGDVDLRNGDMRLVFNHADTNGDHSDEQPFFEGDVITAIISMNVESNVTAIVMSYGINDRLDFGAAIPMVDVNVKAQADLTVQRIATGFASDIHRFTNLTSHDVITRSGTASGVGDISLRLKYHVLKTSHAGIAFALDGRLPTGESRDLLGTGAARVGGQFIVSGSAGKFSPHLNLGYAKNGKSDGVDLPDEMTYTAGFDLAATPRVTFAADVLGTRLKDSGLVRVVPTDFEANTSADPANPHIIHATFPRLQVQRGSATTHLGSIGVKINPFGNLLLTVNGLFTLAGDGLKTRFSPMIGADYSF